MFGTRCQPGPGKEDRVQLESESLRPARARSPPNPSRPIWASNPVRGTGALACGSRILETRKTSGRASLPSDLTKPADGQLRARRGKRTAAMTLCVWPVSSRRGVVLPCSRETCQKCERHGGDPWSGCRGSKGLESRRVYRWRLGRVSRSSDARLERFCPIRPGKEEWREATECARCASVRRLNRWEVSRRVPPTRVPWAGGCLEPGRSARTRPFPGPTISNEGTRRHFPCSVKCRPAVIRGGRSAPTPAALGS